jgi:hypothetical protein
MRRQKWARTRTTARHKNLAVIRAKIQTAAYPIFIFCGIPFGHGLDFWTVFSHPDYTHIPYTNQAF